MKHSSKQPKQRLKRPFNQWSAATIQRITRRLLSLDAESNRVLQVFDGKVIQLQIDDWQLVYYLAFNNGQLSVSDQNDAEISVAISGRVSAFFAAAAAEHSADSIFKGELQFSGDIQTAKQLQQLAQALNIDWQEPLAQCLGDPLGHSLASGFGIASTWLISVLQSTTQDISEYLQEEAKITPSRYEQQHFFQQIDQLRSRCDRLTARVSRQRTVLDKANKSSTNKKKNK